MKREVLKKEYTLVFKQWKSICFSLLVGSFAFFVKDGFIGALTGSFLLYTIWILLGPLFKIALLPFIGDLIYGVLGIPIFILNYTRNVLKNLCYIFNKTEKNQSNTEDI